MAQENLQRSSLLQPDELIHLINLSLSDELLSKVREQLRQDFLSELRDGSESIFATQQFYDQDQLNAAYYYHQSLLTGSEKDSSAYYHFTAETQEQATQPLLEAQLAEVEVPGIEDAVIKIKIGPLSSFTNLEMAATVHDQTERYVSMGTMGDFPRGNVSAEDNLTAIMGSGCSADNLQVLVYFEGKQAASKAKDQEKRQDNSQLSGKIYKPLTGLRIHYGRSQSTIRELNGSPEAGLSTLTALKLPDTTLDDHPELAAAREKDVVCIGRFFNQARQTFDRLNIPRDLNHKLVWSVCAYSNLAYVAHCLQQGKKIPSYAIYDTHLEFLVKKTKQIFAAEMVAQNSGLEPTEAVMDSVLSTHYGSHQISWVYLMTELFNRGAVQYLVANQMPLISATTSAQERSSMPQPHQETEQTNLAKEAGLANETEAQLSAAVEPILSQSEELGLGMEELVDLLSEEHPAISSLIFSMIADGETEQAKAILQKLIAETEEMKTGVVKPYVQPEVINANTSEGQVRLKEIFAEIDLETQEIFKPYEAGKAEVLQLRAHFQRLFAQGEAQGFDFSNPGEMKAALSGQLSALIENQIEPGEIRDVFDQSTLIEDLVYLAQGVMEHGSQEALQAEARYVYYPERKRLVKSIGLEADRLLRMSRLLGLVPFELVRKLKDSKIKVVGASVAASTIQLLVALGAENIEYADGGTLDRSNDPRMPGGLIAALEGLGGSKAHSLAADLHKLNPFARIVPHHAFVGIRSQEQLAADEALPEGVLPLRELLEGSDLVIEVVDSADIKAGLRTLVKEEYPECNVLYMADTGAGQPFVVLEKPGTEGYVMFGQSLSEQDEQFLEQVGSGQFTENPLMALRAMTLMVKDGLPLDHKLQLMLVPTGVVPHFSQTPMASRLSSALAVEQVLRELNGEEVAGKMVTPNETKGTFLELDEEGAEVLSALHDSLFQHQSSE